MNWVVIIGVIVVVGYIVSKLYSKSSSTNQSKNRTTTNNPSPSQKKGCSPIPNFQMLDSNYGVFTEDEKNIVLNLQSDEMSAFATALKGAESNKPDEMCYLGLIYNKTLKNPQKSAYWMQRATKAGSTDAMYFLGTYYMDGYGVKEDRMTGSSLLFSSAQRGNKKAINSLLKNGMTKEQLRSIDINV